jgi:hypothetical protein
MVVVAMGLLISSQAAWAEIPPRAYAKIQDEAGEALQIEVLKRVGNVRRGVHEKSHFTFMAKSCA